MDSQCPTKQGAGDAFLWFANKSSMFHALAAMFVVWSAAKNIYWFHGRILQKGVLQKVACGVLAHCPDGLLQSLSVHAM
jgi:hypothetical protein